MGVGGLMGGRGMRPDVAGRAARGDVPLDSVIVADPGVPSCPWEAGAAEADTWYAIIGALRDAGVLGVISLADFAAVERAAVALCRAQQWTEQVRGVMAEGSWYVETRSNGQLPHPALREEQRAWDTVAKAISELGMSPTSRGAVARSSAGARPADDDELTRKLMAMSPQPVED